MVVRRKYLLSVLAILTGCTSVPLLETSLIRPWSAEIESMAPAEKPYLAHHRRGDYELFYLAARHDTDPKGKTAKLVKKLFREYKFNFLLIEPIPNAEGESPAGFLKEAKEGISANLLLGGESSLAAVMTSDRGIPFAGGELGHRELFTLLKREGYSELDVLGFYLVRQIPQWVREKAHPNSLLEKRAPGFLKHYCQTFGVDKCPSLAQVAGWYKDRSGRELSAKISNEEVAPVHGSAIFTHKISSAIGLIRDRFTLKLIQGYLEKHKKVAVVYGGSHYVTLQRGIEAGMGVAVGVVQEE